MALMNVPSFSGANIVSSVVGGIQSESLFAQPVDWQYDDDFVASLNQTITITCPNKNANIVGLLSDGVKLTGQSNWEAVSQNSTINKIYSVIETIDTLSQAGFVPSTSGNVGTSGISYIQPWAQRKFWKGSNPLSLNFNFNFISTGDGESQVYNPAIKLLSLCYPRVLENAGAEAYLNKLEIPDGSGGKKKLFLTKGVGTDGNPNLVASVAGALQGWSVPGPGLQYQDKDGSRDGDAVTIMIGNLFAFGACYLTKVDIEFSPSFDNKGYPLWCKCSIAFETSESNYCTSDGTFNMGKMSDNANNLGNVLNAIGNTAATFVSDMFDHAEATVQAVIH